MESYFKWKDGKHFADDAVNRTVNDVAMHSTAGNSALEDADDADGDNDSLEHVEPTNVVSLNSLTGQAHNIESEVGDIDLSPEYSQVYLTKVQRYLPNIR